MFRLSCYIDIYNPDTATRVRFDYVNEIEVVTSVRNFTDTAKIKVPRKLAYKGRNITEYIKRNNTITIRLGYDDNLLTVFKGYVTNVSTGTPIEITCENEAWKLKQVILQPKHYAKLNIQDFVKEHMSAYICKVPSVDLGEVRINADVTLANVYDYFMRNYPVNFYFRNDIFYGILPGVMTAADDGITTHKFRIGYNTISDNLVYTLADDVKLQIVAKAITRDNVKLEWKEPQQADDAEVRTFYVPGATSIAELKEYALNQLKEFKIDQMTGEFTAFGIPFVQKGDVVHILDDDNQERHNKKFYVEQVTYSFGQSGYRQRIKLGGQIK